MGTIITVLSVFFVILCVILVLLILLQTDKNAGVGGLLGASSQSTFGSSTADVVTKITTVMVALFFVIALSLAALKAYSNKVLEKDLFSGTQTTESTK